jgi:hypothetical protein
MRSWSRRFAAIVLGIVSLLVADRSARAIPPFAAQTGQPCTACHIGGFGPELTPFGRAFKIGGYTQRGGEGWQSYFPLAAMIQTSFTNTGSAVPPDQIAHHYNDNNNFSLDQISVFLGGGIGEHTGGFVQATYSDVPNASNLDNTDLRPYTTTFQLFGNELRVGTTVNNNPTVQDPYNSSFAWGYPFISSQLAPTPAASPILASGFNNSSVGYTAYLWYDHKLYLEGGAYTTIGTWAQARLGESFGVGSSQGAMPYIRAAYEWDWNQQAFHIGTIFMQSNVNPTVAPLDTDGSMGRDHYQDWVIDGGYQWLGDGTHRFNLTGTFTHEDQNLEGTTTSYNAANGTTFGSKSNFNQVQVTGSYWYKNTYGFTVSWLNIWGPANPQLYKTGIDMTNSANGKPNSNAFILEADWVPFGKEDSWARPFVNLKLGVQYTVYTMFNGGVKNYDGFGRNASDNNTLLLFAWMVF